MSPNPIILGCEQSSMLTRVDPENGVLSSETYCSDMDCSDLRIATSVVGVSESVL